MLPALLTLLSLMALMAALALQRTTLRIPTAASPAEAPLEEAAVAADAELVGASPGAYLDFC